MSEAHHDCIKPNELQYRPFYGFCGDTLLAMNGLDLYRKQEALGTSIVIAIALCTLADAYMVFGKHGLKAFRTLLALPIVCMHCDKPKLHGTCLANPVPPFLCWRVPPVP